jgi:hypothetical protein
MKRLILIAGFVVAFSQLVKSQGGAPPCDISSSGIELRDVTGAINIASVGLNGTASAYTNIQNIGVGMPGGGLCGYAPGEVEVRAQFVPPTFSSCYFIYFGPASFNTAKYSWSYNTTLHQLVGVNTATITTDYFASSENVVIPIKGIKVGTVNLRITVSTVGAISDDINNNIKNLPVNVVAVLPVTLNDIDGTADGCNATLKWAYSEARNFNHFEIESSANGVDFTKPIKVDASSQLSAGNFATTLNQGTGKVFYRLKIVDNDGSFIYSKVIRIVTNCNNTKAVKVYPNPVITNQLLNVNITGYDASVKGDLYTATGQLVKSFILKNGKNELPVLNLAQGFYTLKISEKGQQTEIFKLSVLR